MSEQEPTPDKIEDATEDHGAGETDPREDAELRFLFAYHGLDDEALARCEELRESGLVMARALHRNVPACADRTAALRKIREAVMTGNVAIALDDARRGGAR